MIPLSWLFVAWLILVAVFALLAMFTAILNVRFGLASFGTYATTAVFLLVPALVIIAVAFFMITVDWSQSFEIMPSAPSTFGL